ncbi:MAG TPA: nucleoside triphosphate pyrophosphohydrolase family protein [Chloroflexota bacterium]|nr:nucleoside triphosphate pyrophosphohydrolase family protein [Chloroflexota bacterium]
MSDFYLDKVKEFHRALYGTDAPEEFITKDVALCRLRLIVEEVGELSKAMHENDRIKVADGLADLLYVIYGAAIVYGIPIAPVFDEIHRSNMSKDFPDDTDRGKKSARKGSRYFPPDLQGLF